LMWDSLSDLDLNLWWFRVILTLIFAMMFLFPALLCGFHSFLAVTNQTTYDMIKRERLNLGLVQYSSNYPFETVQPSLPLTQAPRDDDKQSTVTHSWIRYHQGFVGNIVSFCLGRVKDEFRYSTSNPQLLASPTTTTTVSSITVSSSILDQKTK